MRSTPTAIALLSILLVVHGCGTPTEEVDASALDAAMDARPSVDARAADVVVAPDSGHDAQAVDGGADASLGCDMAGACDDELACTDDACLDGTCVHAPVDRDGDGHLAVECGGQDCRDDAPWIAPGALEDCNASDDDCDGTVDDGATCAPGFRCASSGTCTCDHETCSGSCVDLAVTREHCGACFVACVGDASCVDGDCACAEGSYCGPTGCVDLASDERHCGVCARACAPGEQCDGGACTPCGGTGQPCCDGGACLGTLLCNGGACECAPPLLTCGAECRTSGHSDCGACDRGCADDEACRPAGCVPCGGPGEPCCSHRSPRCDEGALCSSGGTCACGSGRADCGGSCVDLDATDAHCGACGTACGAGRPCVDGSCRDGVAIRGARVLHLAMDSTGDVLAAGTIPSGTTVDFDGTPIAGSASTWFVARYGSSLGLEWVRRLDMTARSPGVRMTVDDDGNAYLAASFAGTLAIQGTTVVASGFSDGVLLSLDAAGNLRYARRLTGPGGQFATGVGVDAAGNVFVCGAYETSIDVVGSTLTMTGNGAYLVSWGADGAHRWSTNAGLQDAPSALALDSGGDVYIAGQTSSLAAYVERWSGTGAHGWRRSGGSGPAESFARDIAVGGDGNLYITGEAGTGILFAGTSRTGEDDHFVASFSVSGSTRWVRASSTTLGTGTSIAWDPDASVVALGEMGGAADLGAGTIGAGTFLQRLDPAGVVLGAAALDIDAFVPRPGGSVVVGGDGFLAILPLP